MAVALLVWVEWIINTPRPPKGGGIYKVGLRGGEGPLFLLQVELVPPAI